MMGKGIACKQSQANLFDQAGIKSGSYPLIGLKAQMFTRMQIDTKNISIDS
jgi:hypothetical protein